MSVRYSKEKFAKAGILGACFLLEIRETLNTSRDKQKGIIEVTARRVRKLRSPSIQVTSPYALRQSIRSQEEMLFLLHEPSCRQHTS